jgi:cell division protein FtsB
VSGSRWLIIVLAIAGLGLQAELWFSDDGYRKTLKLRAAVAEQRSMQRSSISSRAAMRLKNALAPTSA